MCVEWTLPQSLQFDTVASWRRKDPIEVGSGVTVISKDPFWSARVSDETLAAEQAVSLRSCASCNDLFYPLTPLLHKLT